MKNLAQHKNLILAIVLILLVGGAIYYYMGQSSGSGASVVAATGTSVDDQLLASLRQLQSIQLDSSVFSNPVWLSLHDYSQPLPSETPGRSNPFAPIGQASTTSAH